jgi:molybdopterin biosynthesis enzyme
MFGEPENQRITQLMPLQDVLALIDEASRPVAPQLLAVATAVGGVLTVDAAIQYPVPATALALRDGWAVAAEETNDGSAYAPAPLPVALRVDAGAPMPNGTDAVAAIDAVTVRGGVMHALAPVAPGDGVLPVGGDLAAGTTLLQRGQLLRHHHVAVLAAAGFEAVSIREPHIRIVGARPETDTIVQFAANCIGGAVSREGGIGTTYDLPLAHAIADEGADAVVIIGGTGSGENDTTVRTLAAFGEIKAHGIALCPGETTAFGVAGGRPVLALPGRLDAALAVWHLLGSRLMARLCDRDELLATRSARLTRKITSTVGLSELIPVRCDGGSATPIASGYLPLSSLAQADGWVLVAANSEGFPAGSEVVVRPWP